MKELVKNTDLDREATSDRLRPIQPTVRIGAGTQNHGAIDAAVSIPIGAQIAGEERALRIQALDDECNWDAWYYGNANGNDDDLATQAQELDEVADDIEKDLNDELERAKRLLEPEPDAPEPKSRKVSEASATSPTAAEAEVETEIGAGPGAGQQIVCRGGAGRGQGGSRAGSRGADRGAPPGAPPSRGQGRGRGAASGGSSGWR